MLGFLTWLVTTILPFLFVITVVITVHELGHFLVARLCGVKIDRFSIGFGKTLFARADRSGVEWRLAALPLGGYVKFAGDANVAGVPDREDLAALRRDIIAREGAGAERRYFHFKPLWQRALIVAAGPGANFVLAVFIFSLLFGLVGETIVPARVQGVSPGTAAAAAGFRPGDLIVSVNGGAVSDAQDVIRTVALNADTPLRFVVERGGARVTLVAAPRRETVENRVTGPQQIGRLGVTLAPNPGEVRRVRYDAQESVQRGARETWNILSGTVTYLGRIAQGKESGDQLGGPIRTAAMSGAVAQAAAEGEGGLGLKSLNVLLALLQLVAFLSVGIGFLNLLPVPVLDGGHLLFYAYEAVARKPLGAKVQEAGYRVGLALLLGLMLFATWNDLQKLSVFKILGGLFS